MPPKKQQRVAENNHSTNPVNPSTLFFDDIHNFPIFPSNLRTAHHPNASLFSSIKASPPRQRSEHEAKSTLRTHTKRPIRLIAACMLTCLTVSPQPVTAQRSDPAPPSPLVPLASAPFDIPSLGLSITLPERAYASISTLAGSQAAAIVYPGEPNQKWQLAIKSHTSSNSELTNTQALDSVIQQLKLTKPVHDPRRGPLDPHDVLNKNFSLSRIVVKGRHQDLEINGVRAERVYLSAPSLPDYPDAGITIFNPEPGKFVLVHLECPHNTIDALKPLFEIVSASVHFRDASELNAKRAAAVLATAQIFDQVNTKDLEALLDKKPLFYRLYRPGPNGRPLDDEEVAWQRISIRKGQSGELTPGKVRTRWTTEDREFGFLMQIDARALWLNYVVDSQGIFFLSRDRENERWSLRNTIRKGATSDTTTQTLVRKGNKLTYVVERPGEPRFTGEFVIPERGYLSKIEAALFPRLIAARELPGEFAYYSFDPSLDTIALKYESFKPDGTGRWESELKHLENALPQHVLYDEHGRILSRTTPDNQRMVPIDPQRLRRIWSNKSLPIDER